MILPSWIVIGCLTGSCLVQRQGGGWSTWNKHSPLPSFSTSRLLPQKIFPCPNPPQLQNPKWQPKTKRGTRAPKIWLHWSLYNIIGIMSSNSLVLLDSDSNCFHKQGRRKHDCMLWFKFTSGSNFFWTSLNFSN